MTAPHLSGPILYLRGYGPAGLDLAAIVVRPGHTPPGDIVTPGGRARPALVHGCAGQGVFGYRFTLPAIADAWYTLDGTRYPVAADFSGDVNLAYVSCNGQEHGDLDRPDETRNAMWRRLGERHREAPLHLLLHGGDQIYADEVPRAHPLSRDWPKSVSSDPPEAELAAMTRALDAAFFARYTAQFAQADFAWLAARVPSLAMWDDHDICDGWGSLPAPKLDSAVGRRLFATARTHFLIFQLGVGPCPLPPPFLDPQGRSLTWSLDLPGLRIIAPDLRSERRPDRILGPGGWPLLERALEAGAGRRVLLLSSVPLLGPRLSLLERAMALTPWMESFEDDLRDQWQSRAHRAEWQKLLRVLMALHAQPETRVTALSGEIHLAARATMRTATGPLHQLIASGISHPPPPRAYARALGALAALGEAPLRGHPIRQHPLPGRRGLYVAERNYLLVQRRARRWTARWDLEEAGLTPALDL